MSFTSNTSDIALSSGRRAVPASRVLVGDVLRLHREIPTCAQDRLMNVAELTEARQLSGVRISWPALFMRSWARVCARHPKLLQSWCTWPWPHVFQHRAPVAMLTVKRTFQNDDWLFWGRVRSPHKRSLQQIQAAIDRFTRESPESVFRQQLQFSRLPSLLRRLLWWWNLNLAGEKRAWRLGTFFLTTVSSLGVEIQHPPGVMTTGLTYGPVDARGMLRVTLAYDHRLMDGSFVASRLLDLENELTGVTQKELRTLQNSSEAASGHVDRSAA